MKVPDPLTLSPFRKVQVDVILADRAPSAARLNTVKDGYSPDEDQLTVFPFHFAMQVSTSDPCVTKVMLWRLGPTLTLIDIEEVSPFGR